MSYTFSGWWSPTGFVADDLAGWKAAKKALQGKRVTVNVSREDEVRTPFQNRRHFVQCQAVAELWSIGGRVVSATQAHYILARAFVGVVMTPLGEVPMATRTMSKADFASFCDRIDAHFASEGHPLPTMEAC